jgi:hypothetical protein
MLSLVGETASLAGLGSPLVGWTRKPVGEDPLLPAAWLSGDPPDPRLYRAAVKKWRRESTSVAET